MRFRLMLGFNPRPLLLTGESTKGLWRDLPGIEFQSTPVIANGRIKNPARGRESGNAVSIHARYC